MSSEFRPHEWTFADRPPYAGEWWGVTRHGTVEKVDVEPKAPEHLGKGDPILRSTDPYVYHFGFGGSYGFETAGSRRWSHWMPVTPPPPPLEPDPIASGLIPPPPGDPVYADDKAYAAPVDPFADLRQFAARSATPTVEHGLEDWKRRKRPRHPNDPSLMTDPPTEHTTRLPQIGLNYEIETRARTADGERWERMQAEASREADAAFHQEKMDREDASAYDPTRYAREAAKEQYPIDLIETVKLVAEKVLGLPAIRRETEYRRLKAINPVMAALVKAAIEEYRRQTGIGEAA